MSNERSEPIYNLRSKRVSAPAPRASTASDISEGFIRASELLRREEELRGFHEDSTPQQEAASKEMVPDIPSNERDEGGSPATTEGTCSTQPTGHQGSDDSAGEAQGQPPTPPHSPLAEQAVDNQRQELLRLRVRVSDDYLDYLLAMY